MKTYAKRRAEAIKEYRHLRSMIAECQRTRRYELVSLYQYQLKELKIEWNL
jgi:hypothetical protein